MPDRSDPPKEIEARPFRDYRSLGRKGGLSERIETGFHRIGLILSFPVAIAGLVFCAMAPFQGSQGWSFFVFGGTITVAAVPIYAVCWALGWIARGFTGD